MKTTQIYFLNAILLISINFPSFSQEKKVFQKFDEYRKENYQEKIYVTTDREFYIAGEIIWFKVYGMDGSLHLPSELSKIAYVELLGADSTAHLQAKIELNEGWGSGSFYIPTSLASGKYLFRAYTNWMKNYDADFFFHKELTIVNTFKKLPPVSSNVDVELQFYPEGGHLVSGIESNIAFQAINTQGHGVDFKGWLINGIGDTLLSFSPDHLGMGAFKLTPEQDEVYKAIIESDGKSYYPLLPEVEERGYVLSVDSEGEVVTVSVETNTNDQSVYLLAHGRNIVSNSLSKMLSSGKATFSIKKSGLIDGINHFTIFNESSSPVAERLYFKPPDDLMSVDINEVKSPLSLKEKINLEISTFDNPMSNLSMSVFKLDSLNKEPSLNIISYLYLLSDLKGQIENPSFYFSEAATEQEVDLLMMTHGWSRFSWDEVINQTVHNKMFAPEVRGHLIQGKITDKETGKDAIGINTYLSVIGKYPRFYVSNSDSLGRIKFELQDIYGTADVILGTNHLIDSTYQIELNDPFIKSYSPFRLEDVQMKESLKTSLIERSIGMQTLNIYQEENLNVFYPSSSDTCLFFMKGDKRYLLDDYTRFSTMEDIMREYMPEIYVRSRKEGFSLRILDVEREVLYENNPLLLYDGMPVFDVNKLMRVDPHKIQDINVITKRYFLGKSTFDGIISCRSYDDDLEGMNVDPTSLIMKYEFAQLQRSFYSPDYSNDVNMTTPDRRNLLFWKADIHTDEKGSANVEFSTSEETGEYLIVIEGLSATGIPGYSTMTFSVNEKLN